jgi:hypothetical protein
MTLQDLKKLATKDSLVQWSPSGRIERIFRQGSTVCLQNVLTRQIHRIQRRDENYEFYCREVHPDEMVRLGDLL